MSSKDMVRPEEFGGVFATEPMFAILGSRKCLTAEQAAKAWGKEIPQDVPLAVRYSEDVLLECAEENRTKGTDWRLVYIFGFSLREQRKKWGVKPDHQPCFSSHDWWLNQRENSWATHKSEPGYYLLYFNGRFGATSWQKQGDKIAKLGSEYERAHEAIVSEAVFSIYQIHGERLLRNWYHWGTSLDSDGSRVSVGRFESNGLVVSAFPPDWHNDDILSVCLLRKFQS